MIEWLKINAEAYTERTILGEGGQDCRKCQFKLKKISQISSTKYRIFLIFSFQAIKLEIIGIFWWCELEFIRVVTILWL